MAGNLAGSGAPEAGSYIVGGCGGTGHGIGAAPVGSPADGNKQSREEAPKRVVVYDTLSTRLLKVMLGRSGVHAIFTSTSEEFLSAVRNHDPHIALVHIYVAEVILKLKADPAIVDTPTMVMNSIGSFGETKLASLGLIAPTIHIPFNQAMMTAVLESFAHGARHLSAEPVPYFARRLRSFASVAQFVRAQDSALRPQHRQFPERLSASVLDHVGIVTDVTFSINFNPVIKMAAELKPDLIVLADELGSLFRSIGQDAAEAGFKVLGLASFESHTDPEDLGIGDRRIEFHRLPIGKWKLIELAERRLTDAKN